MRALPILSVLVLAGCPKGSLPTSMSQYQPTMEFKRVKVESVDFTGAETNFVFRLDNPNPIGLSVASFSYDLDLAGSSFLNGEADGGLTLEPNGHSQFKLPVSLVFADIIEMAGNLGDADDVPFTISGDFGFQTPLGILKIPYNESGTVPVLRAPKIRVAAARVEEFKPLQNRATLAIDLGITHQSERSISLGDFDYKLQFQGVDIADGVLAQVASFDGAGEQTLTLPVNLNLVGMGASIISAISQREQVSLHLTGGLSVDTPLGAIPLNIDETANVNLQ